MPRVQFMLADQSTRTYDGAVGTSVMAIARAQAVPGIMAECGGVCACATCHVHIARAWLAKLPAMQADERELLGFADGVDAESRLGCQIVMTAQLDGLVVHVPAPQYDGAPASGDGNAA